MLKRLIALALCTGAALVPGAAAATPRSHTCTRGLTTVRFDPRALLPLSALDPLTPSVRAVVRFANGGIRPAGAYALRATADRLRGPEARYACGTRVWRRTIVVYLRNDAILPVESMSERAFFVGRVASGYRVWQIVH
jgi:hypothetical protein